MGRGRVGGTRSLISGAVGAEIYYISKNSKGELEQVVQAKPESYARVNTREVAICKMRMSVIERAMGAFKEIIAHSFEGVPEGTESVSEWSRANISLVTQDMTEHWDSVGQFDYTRKDVGGATAGKYLMSRGSLRYSWTGIVRWQYRSPYTFRFSTTYQQGSPTVGKFKESQNLETGDYYTMCLLVRGLSLADTCARYIRLQITDKLADDVVLNEANAWDLWNISTNAPLQTVFEPDGAVYRFTYDPRQEVGLDTVIGWAIIRSAFKNGKWCKSTQFMRTYFDDGLWAASNIKPEDVFNTWYNEE